MSLSFAEEQRAFRSSVRGILDRLGSTAGTRDFVEGLDLDQSNGWQRIDDALALAGLPIPEEFGGQGASWSEVGIVFEELGRTLFPTPYLSLMAAVRILSSCRTGETAATLARIAEGAMLPLISFAGNERGCFKLSTASSPQVGAEVPLSGVSGLVPYHPVADSAIIEARGGDGPVLVAVAASQLRVEAVPTIDLTRTMCTVTADAAIGSVLATEDVCAAVEDARAFIASMVALESVGGADVCLAMTAAYARDRMQFGRAIGSFQGVKHGLADLLRAFEPAKSAAYAALEAIAAAPSRDVTQAASVAKLVADQMYAAVAVESIQLHGAIGFTWEFDLHLHYKRAIANRALGAGARDHRAAVRSAILDLVPIRSPLGGSQ